MIVDIASCKKIKNLNLMYNFYHSNFFICLPFLNVLFDIFIRFLYSLLYTLSHISCTIIIVVLLSLLFVAVKLSSMSGNLKYSSSTQS